MVAMLESGQEYPGILNPSERSSTYFNHYQVSYTSFEDPTSGSYYQDEGDASISRVLENNPGQMSVSHASSGSEMGFETHYESTGGVGFTDGGELGVTDDADSSFPGGSQGFVITDTDGVATLRLDPIEADRVDFQLFVLSATWEAEDYLQVRFVGESGNATFIDTSGSLVDSTLEEGQWLSFGGDIGGLGAGNLEFEVSTNSASEGVLVDEIEFSMRTLNMPGFQVGSAFSQSTLAMQGQNGCAVVEGGELYCWGGRFTGSNEYLHNEVDLSSWNNSTLPQRVDLNGVETVREIVLGNSVYCATVDDWELVCWGSSNHNSALGTSTGGATTRTRPTSSAGWISGRGSSRSPLACVPSAR